MDGDTSKSRIASNSSLYSSEPKSTPNLRHRWASKNFIVRSTDSFQDSRRFLSLSQRAYFVLVMDCWYRVGSSFVILFLGFNSVRINPRPSPADSDRPG